MNPSELEDLIRQSLDEFYRRRIKKLSELKLSSVLRKKNPYLFRAVGLEDPVELVEELLQAYMSSSDETIFGDAFFEPIAKLCSGGIVSPSEGVDVAIETDIVYKAIAVKSGPNIFNSSQVKRQDQEFRSLRSRLLKLHKQFDALLGHGYGRKFSDPNDNRMYRIRSGQAFWEELTGDSDFYIKLILLMRDYPLAHRIEFLKQWIKVRTRFLEDFLANFGASDGGIDWEKLLRYNSGKELVRWNNDKVKSRDEELDEDRVDEEDIEVDEDSLDA